MAERAGGYRTTHRWICSLRRTVRRASYFLISLTAKVIVVSLLWLSYIIIVIVTITNELGPVLGPSFAVFILVFIFIFIFIDIDFCRQVLILSYFVVLMVLTRIRTLTLTPV